MGQINYKEKLKYNHIMKTMNSYLDEFNSVWKIMLHASNSTLYKQIITISQKLANTMGPLMLEKTKKICDILV